MSDRAPLPVLPEIVTFADSATFYEPQEGGGMMLAFVPMVNGAAAPRMYRIPFNAEGWARFQREVAADGVKSPVVEVPNVQKQRILRPV